MDQGRVVRYRPKSQMLSPPFDDCTDRLCHRCRNWKPAGWSRSSQPAEWKAQGIEERRYHRPEGRGQRPHDNALTRQYTALMGTEEVTVDFTEDGIAALARIAAEVNQSVENTGARRLYTVMERVFEELSFTAPDRAGEGVTVDAGFVEENLGELMKSADLSRYVL